MEQKFEIGDRVIRKDVLKSRLQDDGHTSIFRSFEIVAVINTKDGARYQAGDMSIGSAKRGSEFVGLGDALEFALDYVASLTKRIIEQHRGVRG